MANPTYSQLWEMFASGGQGYDYYSSRDSAGWTTGELGERSDYDMEEFYNKVIGPSFGTWLEGGEGFGEAYGDYISDFDTRGFEQAEREFKMSIGDPFMEDDPFSWERVSRMNVDQAQSLLESKLGDKGEYLGGTTGATYGTATDKAEETYTSGQRQQREALSYEKLEGSKGLVSGTSGADLRSGEGEKVSEDVLIEAYKKAEDMRGTYTEGKEEIGLALKSNLDTALTAYLKSVDKEKEDWYEKIISDVQMADLRGTFDFGAGAEYADQINWDTAYEVEEEYGTAWWESTEEEFGPCGIGEVRDADGTCKPSEELGLEYDVYGDLCPGDRMDECGVCGGDGSTCAGTGAEEDQEIYNDTIIDDDIIGNTEGDPCTSNAGCAEGMRCDAGFCLSDLDPGKTVIEDPYDEKAGTEYATQAELQAQCNDVGGSWNWMTNDCNMIPGQETEEECEVCTKNGRGKSIGIRALSQIPAGMGCCAQG